jgi:O-acetyl-ADP-ribose deacetylase (regulator of RNase III)
MIERTYEVGRSSITLRFGDITQSKAEVLVSSDDFLLSMGGGVSATLRRAGGARLAADASKMVPAEVGDVVVSSAGDLPAKYIFHAITIGSGQQDIEPAAIVRHTSQRAMNLLSQLRCSSIAFPAIGAGAAGIPYETVATEMAGALVGAVIDSSHTYRVELFLLDRFREMKPEDFFLFFEQFAARRLGLAIDKTVAASVLAPPPASRGTMDEQQTEQAQRRHEVYKMIRHLDVRRSALEAELIKLPVGGDASTSTALASLRQQLEDLNVLRRSYEGQIDTSPALTTIPDSVFVSSTSNDLQDHRKAVRQAIEDLRLRYVGMEDFSPSGKAPSDLIRQKVTQSKAYLGILAMRYGHVDPGTGLSMTELEYHQAVASAKPLHIFVMDDRAPILAGMVETNSEHYAKLLEFKAHVMKAHTCKLFTTPDDLARKVMEALRSGQA